VVNVAAPVHGLAHNGNILISADAVARVPNDFVLGDFGEHALRGEPPVALRPWD
jgi:class 3 adenylate cyclase